MSDLTLLVVILVAAGGLSGFLAGVFGVGGGTVVVPVLYEVFVMLGVPDELRMPLCAGTSLALIIPTSIASFSSHRKADAVNFDLLRLWSVPIIAGVIGGTVLARYAPAAVFKTVFVLVALLTAGSADIPRSISDARTGRPSASETAVRFDHRIIRIADWNWWRPSIEHDHDVPWARNP
jgi:uncharacterized membrane protein YfcA